MKITILTLFPTYFDSVLATSIIGRALDSGKAEVKLIDIRRFAQDKHKTTDDRPYGGGPGMVMMVEPIDLALQSIGVQKGNPNRPIYLLSARGQLFSQQTAVNLSQKPELILICGHYGDVDQRVADHLVDGQIRIGNFVLTGGEPAAACLLDSVIRLLPETVGNAGSLVAESHHVPGSISPIQYTRPAVYRGWSVPAALISGDPQQIKAWQATQPTSLPEEI